MIEKPFNPFTMAQRPFDEVAEKLGLERAVRVICVEQVFPGCELPVVMDPETGRALGRVRERSRTEAAPLKSSRPAWNLKAINH